MSIKIDDLVMLIPVILMGRQIPVPDQEVTLPAPKSPEQKMNPAVTNVNANRQPRNVQATGREVTRGPQDASPVDRFGTFNPIIEPHYEYLKAGQEGHEHHLNDHDVRFKEHEARMEKQDTLIGKFDDILVTFKNTKIEHIGWTRATHRMAATSFFRWLGDESAADELDEENM